MAEIGALAYVELSAYLYAWRRIPEHIGRHVGAVAVCTGCRSVVGFVVALAYCCRNEELGPEIPLQSCTPADSPRGLHVSRFFRIGHEIVVTDKHVASERCGSFAGGEG